MHKNVSYSMIPIEKIKLDEGPFTPLDPETFKELKESIKKYGLVYPLVVTKHHENPDYYLVLDGRNRYRALLELGVREVPVYIMDVDFPEAYIISYETELFRRHLDREEKLRAISDRTKLEKELVREYKRRIVENLSDFITEDLKEIVLKDLNDLSVLIDLYYATERFAQVAPALKKNLFKAIAEKILQQAGTSSGNVDIERLKKERDEYRLKVSELSENIKKLETEKEKIEKDLKKIYETLQKKAREEILKDIASSDDRISAAMKEYKKALQERIAKEEAEARQKIKSLTRLIDELKKELEEAKSRSSSLEEEIKKIRLEKERLKNSVRELKESFSRAVSLDAHLSEIDATIKRIKNLKSFLTALDEGKHLLREEEILLLRERLQALKEVCDDTLPLIKSFAEEHNPPACR